ncbi:MAG: mismatch-specific DNA-glycosylase [Nitrospirota bacterium]|nr:mismatch-specific DNA-glycosylase [Nitrospirota bacterium]
MSRISLGLPDYLAQGLSILFVGINPGLRSSELGHHYAGHSNRFWKLLFDGGLVPSQLSYLDDQRLMDYGYGLTNLVAKPTTGLRDLGPQDFLQGRRELMAKIQKYQPALVAVLGMTVAQVLLLPEPSVRSAKRGSREPIHPGLQPERFTGVPVFVLPNPSGRNAHYSYQSMKALFCELKTAALQAVESSGH